MESKLNIIHVIACYPPHAGGMEQNTKINAEEMVKRGHNVTVFTSDVGYKTGTQKSKNLTIHYLKSFVVAHTPIIPELLIQLLKIPNDSVVHLHIAQAFVPEIAFIVCKIKKIPYLAHIHLDIDSSGIMGFLLPFYKKFLLGPILRNADAVTVLTKDYKKLMQGKYGIKESKIKLIPNGTYYTPGKLLKTKIHNPLRLLFLGRLSNQKNIPLLIEAVAICIHKYKIPLKLTLVGEGEEKNKTVELIKRNKITKFVDMFESNNYKKNQSLFRSHDVFLLTSRSEAFGTVVTEAMASGTPVIATNILSVRNIITNDYNGFLVDSEPESFAEAIKTLVESPGVYRKFISNGLKTSIIYNWDMVIDKYEKLYFNLLHNINK